MHLNHNTLLIINRIINIYTYWEKRRIWEQNERGIQWNKTKQIITNGNTIINPSEGEKKNWREKKTFYYMHNECSSF